MNSTPEPYMLVIEDSDEDFMVLQRILTKSAHADVPLIRCCDGDEALDFLYRQGDFQSQPLASLPSLILLDLNLPGSDGQDVLCQVKQDEKLKIIPVIVFTTSANPKDIESCYQYGANSYLIKTMDIEQLKASVCLFMDYWFCTSRLPDTPL